MSRHPRPLRRDRYPDKYVDGNVSLTPLSLSNMHASAPSPLDERAISYRLVTWKSCRRQYELGRKGKSGRGNLCVKRGINQGSLVARFILSHHRYDCYVFARRELSSRGRERERGRQRETKRERWARGSAGSMYSKEAGKCERQTETGGLRGEEEMGC